MRNNKLLIFIVISIIIHLIVLSLLDLSTPEKEKERPISVSVIPKEKPKPAPKEEPAPEAKTPKKTIDDVPLDEDLKTDLDQMAPVPDMGEEQKQMKQKSERQGDEPPEKPEETQQRKQKESSKQEIIDDNAPVQLPSVTPKDELSQGQIDDILNPEDIIDKYAKGGGMPEGEDSVSMQYVKLKYQSYFYKFARRLYQVWAYPRSAAMRGEQGTVRISFVISKDGMISSIKVLQSSGYPDLDREAVSALKKTAGVPLPESYELNFLKVDAYFQYILGGGYIVY
ncbi:TonB family protein [Denitrovibrio acetiphilus DSM 12809]|uniref:TonB family protein n=1 Tax=Denitrovibrio acetiphilus (strain DSM 12809 / NBRC 114555 / N2460) TaxID=522772 RepID=D4H8X1_DENA2|nr:energy transducer TonB [Denitrovibrio acetiphilus]ADD68470.1 TonB family protein [Denitrovibrio acetiphilus DSM 12809]